MTYEGKRRIADEYIGNQIGLGWDDLADINSLHDAETKEDVITLCRERMDNEELLDASFYE